MLVAAGTYIAQDLRDADGLVRPLLRRAALSLALSPRYQARRLGSAHLRLDPSQAGQKTPTTDLVRLPSPPPRTLEEAHDDVSSLLEQAAARVEPDDGSPLQ